jgi:hypothetical protein
LLARAGAPPPEELVTMRAKSYSKTPDQVAVT